MSNAILLNAFLVFILTTHSKGWPSPLPHTVGAANIFLVMLSIFQSRGHRPETVPLCRIEMKLLQNVLYCAAMYAVLYSILLHCVLYCTVLCCTVLFIAPYCTTCFSLPHCFVIPSNERMVRNELMEFCRLFSKNI